MAVSMNREVEYVCKGTSYMSLQSYGKIMVGDKSFEFYDDRNVENYIQIPWEEINYIVADVAFGGKWIPRFEVQTFHNGNYRFSAGKDTKPLLRACREHVPADHMGPVSRTEAQPGPEGTAGKIKNMSLTSD